MKRLNPGLCLPVLLLIGFSVLSAQTYQDALRPFWTLRGFGASSFSLANSSEMGRDASTLALNPANLASVQRPSAYMAFQYGLFDQEGQLESNAKLSQASDSYFRYDGFGFAYPIPVYRGTFVLGFSYTPTAQYNNVVESEGFADYDTTRYYLSNRFEESGTMHTLRLGTSLEIRKNLFFGFSLNFYRGERRFSSYAVDTDTMDAFTYSTYYRDETILPEYGGLNADFGLAYHTPNLQFGLRLPTPVYLSVREVSQIDETEYYDDGSSYEGEEGFDLEYNLKYPMEIASNIALSLRGITLAFDFTVHDWSGIDFNSNLSDDENVPIDGPINHDLGLKLRTTTDIGIALTLPLRKTLSTKFGYRLIPRPYYDLPDDEQYIHLMGVGLESKFQDALILGLNYQTALGNRQVLNSYFGTTSHQDFQEHQLTISAAILL